MIRIASSLVTLAVLAASGSPMAAVAAETSANAALAQLDWLAGCWERRTGTRIVEEQWMTPRGELMLGMSRTVDGERTREYEQTLIRADGAELVFIARPSGQAEASFRAREIGARRVVFENLEHDFPHRVIYALDDDGQLAARIEGVQQGRVVGIDFPYRRVACPGPASG